MWAGKARRYVLVARLIMNAGPGEAVSCIDGNRLNLRIANLCLEQSTLGKNRDRDLITENTRSVRPKAIHLYHEKAFHEWEFKPMNYYRKEITTNGN